ncbi:MAG: hypothetical protein BA874_00670 [Desulfuromonadales bacterium C00003068]|jgi:hypothetical protein|nr:MAG: hypothetical protein BA874_00670 [Desulfuromonadales bacterium C00003068]
MAIAGSPKKLAQDIADGYMTLSPPMLRRYTGADMKIMINNIAMITRSLRQLTIAQDDALAIKQRNNKMSRLNQATVIIRSYCKKRRIPC